MSGREISNNQKNVRKIIIMGLNNSGKTSILLSLTENANLLAYFPLKPTRGIKIIKYTDEGSLFTIWEFGGQEKYRITYFKDFDKHLINVKKMIFVIDIQDIDRYEIALGYLKEIIDLIMKKSLQIEISIYLHKFDPNIETQEDFTSDKINSRLIKKIQDIIPSDLRYTISQTSIYTIFRKKVILKH